MLFFRKAKKEPPSGKTTERRFSASLDGNVALLREIFSDVDPLQYRFIENRTDGRRFCFVYFNGIVDNDLIDQYVLRPLMTAEDLPGGKPVVDFLLRRVLWINGGETTGAMSEIIRNLSYGDSLLLADGADEALLIDTKNFHTRAVAEPEGEKILSGPREGFTESLLLNLSLVRRKLRTNDLKMKFITVGERAQTQLTIVYLESLVNQTVLAEVKRRLDAIRIDAILDANYITELIRDHPRTIFRTTGYTERPDVVAGKMLEGRVAIFVDGTPVVLTVPYLFIENFQSSEDYYLNFYYTSFSRLLRIIGFLLSITVPALYVATVSFHQEMLPVNMMINIAVGSHNVPLPSFLEAFALIIMFDILRETGLRMPTGIGQALSIVGALVVGQAAVEANFITAPMIIIAAISGITSLLVPKMNAPVIIIRLGLLLLASFLGFFGLTLGLSVVAIHVLNLESFGVEQLTRDGQFGVQALKDTLIRAPWDRMYKRPEFLAEDAVRMRRDGGERR